MEETSESLRPTWLPVDPSTYAPPRIRTKKLSFAMVGKMALGLVAIFVLSFGGVVAPHFAREFAARRAIANASAIAAARPSAPAPIATSDQNPSSKSATSQTKAVASGFLLTVDVNDLPVSKDFPQSRKAHAAGSRRGS